jgi:imidazolonepropionase-like amidohydrolase
MRLALLTPILAWMLVSAARAQESASSSPSATKTPTVTAFVGATVLPMDRDVALEDQTVVVVDGRIAALGPRKETEVPAGARVIESQGAYLMPGLADMHVHAWIEDDLFLFVANGVTAIRNMFGSELHLAWRERIAAGELVGPLLHTAGPIIDGNPPVWPGSSVLTDPARAEELVVEQAEAGYDFLKPYAMLSPEVYDALAVAAKKHGLALMGHVPESVDLEHVLAAGQRTIEHLNGWAEAAQRDDSPFAGKVQFANEDEAWQHLDEEKLEKIAQRTKEAGAWNCPTLVVFQKWVQGTEAEALLARPEMRYVSPQARSYWAPKSTWNYLSGLPPERAAAARDSVSQRMRAVAALHRAGARILAGTDMGNPYVTPGFALHEELANLVQAGLSPYEALRAATVEGAECLGADWGSVAVGRRADLLLLEANPLEDVRNASRLRGVMLAGRWLPIEELRAELELRAERFADEAAK